MLNNVIKYVTSTQGLERNLLTPDQIASQDYIRDRAKVVPRGSASPTITPRFKPMFALERNVADSEPYKALADLARAANVWTQFKRNLLADNAKLVFKEMASRHSDLANALKKGLTRKILRFYDQRLARQPLHFLTVREQVLPLKMFVGRPKQINWKSFFWKILSGRISFGKSLKGNLANVYFRSQSSSL